MTHQAVTAPCEQLVGRLLQVIQSRLLSLCCGFGPHLPPPTRCRVTGRSQRAGQYRQCHRARVNDRTGMVGVTMDLIRVRIQSGCSISTIIFIIYIYINLKIITKMYITSILFLLLSIILPVFNPCLSIFFEDIHFYIFIDPCFIKILLTLMISNYSSMKNELC